MKPSHSNAFRLPAGARSVKGSGKGISSPALSSMTAVLRETDFGWSLKLSPMRAFDALRIWPSLANTPEACSLLYDVKLAGVELDTNAASRLPRESDTEKSIAELADHLGISVIERFSSEVLALDDLAVRELVGMTNTQHVTCVLVDGPIEARDAEAIIAIDNPLAAEFRAVATMTVNEDRHVTLDTRTRDQALHLVSENFRHYLAAIQEQPVEEFDPPPTWQLERLFEVSGSLTVRPIETDVFSHSIDVGISTATLDGSSGSPSGGPADRSLIYDLPSRTWHDEA